FRQSQLGCGDAAKSQRPDQLFDLAHLARIVARNHQPGSFAAPGHDRGKRVTRAAPGLGAGAQTPPPRPDAQVRAWPEAAPDRTRAFPRSLVSRPGLLWR